MGRRRPRRGKEEPKSFWESYLFKLSSRLLLGVAVVVMFLTLTQCTVKKPEAPEWNTTFVVPLINRTYDMEELVSMVDQDEILIDTSGDVAISISEDLDTVGINDDDFSVDDLSYGMSDAVGSLRLNPPPPVVSSISLDSITAGFPTVPGFDSVIIPANTEFDTQAERNIAEFAWAEISSGSVKIVVTNELGFTFYDVVVRVVDSSDGRTIDYDSLGVPLPHGGIDSATLILDGETISNNLCFSVCGHTDPLNPVLVDPTGKRIQAISTFSDPVEVITAQAQIPALDDLTFSQKVGLDLGASETIDSATLASGDLNIAIINNTGLTNEFELSIPGLTQGGVPLLITRQVTAGQTALVNTDLSGYVMIPTDDSISIDAIGRIPGSGGQLVIVSETDSVSVDASLTNLSFDEVTGVFANTSASFDDIHEELDIPDGFDNVSLVTAIMTVDIENGADLPGHVDVTISGDNGKVINISGDIESKGDQPFRITTLVNDDVADFLSPLPQNIDVSGTVEFGDDLYHGTISRDDYVFARVHVYAPLEIRINNAEITDLDIEHEEIEQDDIDMITDHVVNARFVYTVTNHLPLGVTALVHLSNDSTSLFTSPLLSIDTLSAEPAPVSLATGIATSAAISSGEINLDNDDIQILKNDTLFIRQQLFLNASDTSGVKLTENDYITISGRIEVEYLFDGEF